MEEPPSDDSPLEAAAGATSSYVAEAFSALGNETRLAILLALWERYDPFTDANAVSFSDLYDTIGLRDSGQFNYHLDKLTGHFIRKSDDGYELRRAGQKLVRAVIAGRGLEEPEFGPAEIDLDCWLCGAPTAVTYQDEWLYHVCTECDGLFAGDAEEPDGYLGGMSLDPAGLTHRSPEDLLAVSWMRTMHHLHMGVESICNECSGEMARSLHICGEHEPDGGVCTNCGRHVPVVGRLRCTVCKTTHMAPPRLFLAYHPAVIAFYHEHGITIQYGRTTVETFTDITEHVLEAKQEVISNDPPQVRVTFTHNDDTISLTLESDLKVIEERGTKR